MRLDAPHTAEAAVAVTCDAAYLPFAAATALSIDAAHPDRDFDLLIASPEPLDLPASLTGRGIANAVCHFGDAFGALLKDARRSLATYAWLPVASSGYARTLTLDSDMLCLDGDLSRLLRTPLHGAAVAAVRDNRQWRTPSRRPPLWSAIGASGPYLNGGAVLIDRAAWSARDMPARCLAFAPEGPAGLESDQSLLNGVLRGDFAELSPVWNWQMTDAGRLFAEAAGARILHWIGPRKPWRDAERRLPPYQRRPFREALERDWPDHPALAGFDLEGGALPGAKTLLRHLKGLAATRRYLARFPDPYAALPPGRG